MIGVLVFTNSSKLCFITLSVLLILVVVLLNFMDVLAANIIKKIVYKQENTIL